MSKKEIDSKRAEELVNAGAAVFVDIRTIAEVKAGAISNSFYLPQELVAEQALSRLGVAEDCTIIFYCRSGSRSGRLVSAQPELHGGNIYSLQGGIEAWQGDKGSPSSQPIDIIRQTHIVVGLLILFSLLLGTTVSSTFYIFTACFGGGLLFAGLSGTCMMANLLQLLPWNRK